MSTSHHHQGQVAELEGQSQARKCGRSKALATLLLASVVMFMFFWIRSGSLYAFNRFMQGDRVVVTNPVSDMGLVKPGSKSVLRFEIRNLGLEPARLIGSQASCACTVLSDRFPVRIEPGQSHWLQLQYSAPEESGAISKTLTVHTDSPSPTRFELQIHGNVRNQ